jgi:Spy/CpxP family protein refolding chaperone
MRQLRGIVATFVMAALAAGLGVWGGSAYVQRQMHRAPALHELLHDRLNLTGDQARRIEALEKDHAVRRKALEAEMRSANAELSQAYQEAHAYTPKVQAAIDRFHRAMGSLQAETLQHVIAMRSVLRADQSTQFDDTVVKSLTVQAP